MPLLSVSQPPFARSASPFFVTERWPYVTGLASYPSNCFLSRHSTPFSMPHTVRFVTGSRLWNRRKSRQARPFRVRPLKERTFRRGALASLDFRRIGLCGNSCDPHFWATAFADTAVNCCIASLGLLWVQLRSLPHHSFIRDNPPRHDSRGGVGEICLVENLTFRGIAPVAGAHVLREVMELMWLDRRYSPPRGVCKAVIVPYSSRGRARQFRSTFT